MVTVSQQPYLKRIQGEIGRGVGLKSQRDTFWNHGYQVRSRLMVRNSRVLLILDDVWEAFHELENLVFPDAATTTNVLK